MDNFPNIYHLPPLPARQQPHRAARLATISESLITDLASRLLRPRVRPGPSAMPDIHQNMRAEEAANQENNIETLVDRLNTEQLRRILIYAVGVERNLRDINRNLTNERDTARIELSRQEEWLWAEVEESTRARDLVGQRDGTIIQLRRQLNVADGEISDLSRDLQIARERQEIAQAGLTDAPLANVRIIRNISDNERRMIRDDSHVLVSRDHVDFLQAHIRNLQEEYTFLRAGLTDDQASQELQQSQSASETQKFTSLPPFDLFSPSDDSSVLSSPTYQRRQSQPPSEIQTEMPLPTFESFSTEAELSSPAYDYSPTSLAFDPASPEYAQTSPVYSPEENHVYNASPYYSPTINPLQDQSQDHVEIEQNLPFPSFAPDGAFQHEDSYSSSTLRHESASDREEFLNKGERECSTKQKDSAVPSIGQKRSLEEFLEDGNSESYKSEPKEQYGANSGWGHDW